MKKRVFLTGATGTMGGEVARLLIERSDEFDTVLLLRPSKKNRRWVEKNRSKGDFEVVWGDLRRFDDVKECVAGADYVLHVGGMVSPVADYTPELTMAVNVGAVENIVRAVKETGQADTTKVVYVGSVSQYGFRPDPMIHWAQCGDPLWSAKFDYYALSKIRAERVLGQSGLKYWVSIRLGSILSEHLVQKAMDPITFHVPPAETLEWTSLKDSGNVMLKICETNLPDRFWRNFYNLSSGAEFRLSNINFERKFLKAMHCPEPEKIFKAKWFAVKNFHGCWYNDADRLEEWLHFRSGESLDSVFKEISERLPFYYKLASLVPAFVMRMVMGRVAHKKPFGTMYWVKHDPARIDAYYGGAENLQYIRSWESLGIEDPADESIEVNHGYDEEKDESLLDIDDMRQAAAYRGGRLISESMSPGDLDTSLTWECHDGHRFEATPRLVLKGGHWCPECFDDRWDYERETKLNPFFGQIYRHSMNDE